MFLPTLNGLNLISIHALREEGDASRLMRTKKSTNFYPRPPRGGRRRHRRSGRFPNRDFYPRPPRGGRLLRDLRRVLLRRISIHALREEGDFFKIVHRGTSFTFLSTPSARRATYMGVPLATGALFLSTPSARRATQRGQFSVLESLISIHALREEGDKSPSPALCTPSLFLSTPSARRATRAVPPAS